MIATHMNAPYGKIVSESDVVASFKNGHLSASSDQANAILEALFTEVPAELIMRCAQELSVPLETVNALYLHALSGLPLRSHDWEEKYAAIS